MSKTPVVTSVDVKARVASHLSKVPFIATDAFTANLMELSSVVILKTGTWARLDDGNIADARRQRTANRKVLGVSFLDTNSSCGLPESNQVNPKQCSLITRNARSEVPSNVSGMFRHQFGDRGAPFSRD